MENVKELEETIELAQKELCNLYDRLSPAKPSWTDRQFNQVMRLLREAKVLLPKAIDRQHKPSETEADKNVSNHL